MKNYSLFCLLLSIIMIASCATEQKEVIEQGEPDLSISHKYTPVETPTSLHSGFEFFSTLDNPVVIESSFIGNILIDIPIDITSNLVNVTDAGANLGRVLFYDKKLSLNNTIACGSCHQQDKGFADGLAVSPGFEGRITTRNSMAITNPMMQNNLFWDSRSQSIHDLSLRPVQNHIEMGMEDLGFLKKKLSAYPYYRTLFTQAYGDPNITTERLSDAISQFIASITTPNAKFDAVLRNQASLTELEKLGANVFFSAKAKCSSCHAGTNFSAPDGTNDPYGGGDSFGSDNPRGTANIGLDLIEKDKGKENGQFKIPSLRNIELTAPYMHDGRFKTLEEVLNHYAHGIKASSHLDPKFKDKNGRVAPLPINELEKKALIAFLKTLTDHNMVANAKFSDPFKN